MARTTDGRALAVAAVLLGLTTAWPARAQPEPTWHAVPGPPIAPAVAVVEGPPPEPDKQAAPQGITPGSMAALAAPVAAGADVTPLRVGSAGPYAAPAQSPLLVPDIYALDRPGETLGWYANAEFGLLKPHVISSPTTVSPLPGSTAAAGNSSVGPIDLPFAPYDWTVSPRLELGYRFDGGRGDLRLTYRLISSDGTGTAAGPGGGSLALRSRLDLNVVDLDYLSNEWLVETGPDSPLRDLRWGFGVRLATAYLDSAGVGGPVADVRQSTQFVGAGLKWVLDWTHALRPAAPVAVFVRFEGAGLVGDTRQNTGIAVAGPDGRLVGSAVRGPLKSDGPGTVNLTVGARWCPERYEWVRFAGGYQFEYWWNLGRTDVSRADLMLQGLFLRAEFRY